MREAEARGRARDLVREGAGGVRFALAYFFLAALLAVIYSWPLATGVSNSFFGFPGDSLSGIWGIWWLDFSTSSGLAFREVGYLAHPFGWDFSGAPLPYLFVSAQYALVKAFGDIAAFNIMKLLNFPLLALTTYSLLNYLTRDRETSALFGLAAAFSPYHAIHLMAHFANLYWLPLSILFLLKTLREGGYANPLLLGLVTGLLTIDNAYFGFFFMLLVPLFVVFHLPGRAGAPYLLKATALSGFVFSAVVVPMAWPVILGFLLPGSVGEGLDPRRLSDLFIFSAKPLDYLLPSVHNPFLGRFVPDLGISPLKGHRYTEHTLYLGYTVLFLSAFAIYAAFRDGRPEARRTALLFLAAALFMILLSAPPFIPLGGLDIDIEEKMVSADRKIVLPQYLIFKVFPFIRAYARAGGAAMLAFIVLAAMGFHALFGRSSRKRAALACVALLLAFEFAEFPGFRITRPALPEAYRWLETQPGGAVIEYPFGSPDDPFTTYEYMFYQRAHRKPLVNTPAEGSLPREFVESIRDIGSEGAALALAGAGVKYVVIHRDKYREGNGYLKYDWLTTPPAEKVFPREWGKEPASVPGLKLVMSEGDIEVYETAAPPGLTPDEFRLSLK